MPKSSDGSHLVPGKLEIEANGFHNESTEDLNSRNPSPSPFNNAEPFSPIISDHSQRSTTHFSKRSTTRQKILIWSFIDISGLTPAVQYFVLASGVLTFFLAYGYLQEKVTSAFKNDHVHLSWFMTAIQFAVYTAFTFMQTSLTGRFTQKANPTHPTPLSPPLHYYALIGFCSVASMGLSNTSCEYLSYPTQVMFKCSKLIPVMIVGVLMLKKQYKPLDYLASVAISLGLIVLSLADHQSSANFDLRGIIPISLSLFAGAFIGNFQEKLYRQYSLSEGEMIYYTKGCGFLALLLIILLTGQLQLGYVYAQQHPEVLGHIVCLALTGVLGEYFIMLLTRLFGALVTVTTTSLRKAATLYLSFLLFPKPYSHKYPVACTCIFIGIFLNLYSKNKHQIRALLGVRSSPRAEKLTGHNFV